MDLNTATLEQLDEVPGIGESKAKAILDYRLKKGRFSRIEELIEVKGIGEKMLEKLKVLSLCNFVVAYFSFHFARKYEKILEIVKKDPMSNSRDIRKEESAIRYEQP